jgi:hypothetical protein
MATIAVDKVSAMLEMARSVLEEAASRNAWFDSSFVGLREANAGAPAPSAPRGASRPQTGRPIRAEQPRGIAAVAIKDPVPKDGDGCC